MRMACKVPRKLLAAGGALALCVTLAGCGDSDSGVPAVNVYGGTSDVGFDKIIKRCNSQAKGKYRIVPNLLPSDADGQREQFVRRLAAHDSSMDLLGMDVTWTAEFAEAGWLKELTGAQREEATKGVLAPPIKTAEWKDKLYGIPKHTNVQLLWYRKDLVKTPPKTWDDVIAQAKKLKAANKPYQIGFTGAQYEGYVVGFNTILASVGGSLVNKDSTKVTVDDKTVEALKILKALGTDGLANKSLSNSQEPEVFAQLQNGSNAFAINWPYVLSAMKGADPKMAAKLGWTKLPEFEKGKTARATLGGMNYAVSSYSKYPKQAFDAAMCLRDEKSQLDNALAAGNPPVLESIFEKKDFQKAYPMYSDMLEELKTAVPRPVTPLYQNISTIVSSTLSPPGGIEPEKSAKELKANIKQALEGKGILP